jgi:nucleoside-diphosphate-sugar epimerase
MRILLIGGNGFIGRHVVAALQREGHALTVFHRGSAPAPENVDEILGDRHDLAAHAGALHRVAADVVIDVVLSSERQATQLVEVFRGQVRRLVALSSMDVYRAAGVLHRSEPGSLQELPLTEDSALRTRPLYRQEHLAAMRSVFSWVTDDYDKVPAERAIMREPDLPGTVLRLPMIYGPGDPLHRFWPVVKRVLDGRKHIILPEPLAAWRAPRGYVENVAAAIALAATDGRAAGRIYNVCEEPAFTELEWSGNIAAAMHWDGEFVVLPPERAPKHLLQPGNTAQHWVASSARIRTELGYREPVALEAAIRRTVEWEQAHPPAQTPFYTFDYAAEDAALRAL